MMAVPIMAVGGVASISNLSTPMLELVKEIINDAEEQVTAIENQVAAREEPWREAKHVGLGFRMHLDTTHLDGEGGYASDLDARIDMFALPIIEGDTTPPVNSVPAIEISTDLRYYDEDGEVGWISGGALEANRIRSIDTSLRWDGRDWDCEMILNDASHQGVIDWDSGIPGRISLKEDSDVGFAECLNHLLSNKGVELDNDQEATWFLSMLVMMGVATKVPTWAINPTALTTLQDSTSSHLNALMLDPSTGDWDLTRTLPTSGESFFDHLEDRLEGNVNLVNMPGHPKDGALKINIPMNLVPYGLDLYIHPHGVLEFDAKNMNLGGTRLSLNAEMDIAGVSTANQGDYISYSCDAKWEFGIACRGPFAGAYLHLDYHEDPQPGTVGQHVPLTIDLHLPAMTKILAPLHQLGQSDQDVGSWISTPDSIRIYPEPLVDGDSLSDFLSTATPTLVIETLLKTLIDAYLLQDIKDNSVFGELLEVFDLVEHLPDGRYRCASLLDFAMDPTGYLKSMLIIQDGLNVGFAIEVAAVFLEALQLPIRRETVGSYEAVVFEISQGQDSHWAELWVSAHTQDPNGLTIELLNLDNGAQNAFELEASIKLNILQGPTMNIEGSGLTLRADPYVILQNAGMVNATFAQGSKIEISAAHTSGQLNVSLLVNLDGANDAVMQLLPNISGVQSFISTLMGSATNSVLPALLTVLMHRLVEPGDTQPLGDALVEYFHDIGIWTANSNSIADLRTGSFIPNEISNIANNPKLWLLGTAGTPGKLEDVLIGAVRVAANHLIDDGGDITVNANVMQNAVEFIVQTADFDFTILVGRKNANECGIWGQISTGIVGDTPLTIALDVGCLIDGAPLTLTPSAKLTIEAQSVWTAGDLGNFIPLEPKLTIEWRQAAGLELAGQTCPLSPPDPRFHFTWNKTDGFNYGAPSLSDMVKMGIETAFRFIEGVDKVQDWLDEELITGWVGSAPGNFACALGVMTVSGNDFVFKSVNDIDALVTSWKNDPVNQIIPLVLNLIPPQGINLCTIKDGDVDLKLIENSGKIGFGVEIKSNFAIPLGSTLELEFHQQDLATFNDWTSGVEHGINVYLVDLSSNPASISTSIQVDIGGIGFILERTDGKAMLDKLLMLNRIESVFALSLPIGGSSIKGAQLILDDFGISLGGDGGNNSVAQGVLTGDGDDSAPVMPTFDIILQQFAGAFNVSLRGQTRYVYPVNKEFGPISISQIEVAWLHATDTLEIAVDGKAELAGFQAEVDDLYVQIPILTILDFSLWKFGMRGASLSFESESISISGAVRSETGYSHFHGPDNHTGLPQLPAASGGWTIPDPVPTGAPSDANQWWAVEYTEYQGMLSITTPALGVSAVGAIARVPTNKPDGSKGFMSVLVIASVNAKLGGPPVFFVTGLVGGLGINRDLILPDISEIPDNLLIKLLNDPSSDPMTALQSIKTSFPVKQGSYWFAAGLQFTTFKVVTTEAVLFIQLGDGFKVGLLGLSSMVLPDENLKIASIQLAIMAYYDSQENMFLAQAGLTDQSWLFSETCRLTGGFALGTWFNTGDFVLSIGGYHPNFSKPSHYPLVDRLGFDWRLSDKITIKGGTYFTICSSAAMVGGSLDVAFKSGKLEASFGTGINALVYFDPFKYEVDAYISVYAAYGWLSATIGASIEIMGPKMRGIAEVEWTVIKFQVKFGNWNTPPPDHISLAEFIHKHVLQSQTSPPSSIAYGNDWITSTITKGEIQQENSDTIMRVSPEFNLRVQSKFPNEKIILGDFFDQTQNSPYDDRGIGPTGNTETSSNMVLGPVANDPDLNPFLKIQILDSNDQAISDKPTSAWVSRKMGRYASILWSNDSPGSSSTPTRKYLDAIEIEMRSEFGDAGSEINLEGNVEPCTFHHHLPLTDHSFNSITGISLVLPDNPADYSSLGLLDKVQINAADKATNEKIRDEFANKVNTGSPKVYDGIMMLKDGGGGGTA